MNPIKDKAARLFKAALNNRLAKVVIGIGCLMAGAYILGGTFHAMTFMVTAFRGLMKAFVA